MFRRKQKTAPVIPPRYVEINKGYYDLSPAEQRKFLENFLNSLSPNEEVRKRAREEAARSKDQG